MRITKLAGRIILTLTFFTVSSIGQLMSQCTFNCNDTIHVSVNNMCEAIITADAILEDPAGGMCNYGIQVFNENGQIVDPDLDFSNKKLPLLYKVRVFEQGANPENSCWGYVLFEDKLPPEIICPPNDTIKCYQDQYAIGEDAEANLRAYLKSKIINNLIDNCGNEEISITIIRNDLDRECAGPFSAIQIVEYDALDKNFNATRCIDTIYYERLPFDEVDAPKNYKDNMALKCYGNWDKDGDGLPSVEELIMLNGDLAIPNVNGTDVTDFLLCNFKMTYSDQLFPDCGPTFKIVRTWTVIDWCEASSPKFYYQVIKVIDDRIIVTFPGDITDIVANPWSCEQTVQLPAPTVSQDECSDWTWAIMVREPGDSEFVAFGGPRGPNVQSANRTFPLGKSTIKYTVEDICGNVKIDSFCVTVIDQDEPVAVCDYRTVITLNENYLGKAFANSFDDGSFDGCSGIVSHKVRRVDRFTTGCPTPLDWDDFVKFCCEDIGKTIMVELQVTDGVGLTSICMAEAVVQFKGPGPDITCPPDLADQDCRTYDSFNINSLQGPIIISTNPCLQGSLGTDIREVGRSIDDCGDGYIDVEWYTNYTGTEEVICSQRINFVNLDPFDESDINWPVDRNITSCENLDPTDSEDANLYDRERPCSNIVRTYEDDSFDNVSGYCRKVLRTWTVIDWCQFNSSSSGNIGIWTHVQKILVFGSDDPVFGSVPGIVQINENQNDCEAEVTASGLASDDCTADEDLSWTHQVDLLFGSTSILIIPESSGPSFQRTLDIGTYKITWKVSDHCGNVSTATQTFEVSDNQEPSAICQSGSGNINQNTGQLIVFADDLDGGSTDNCDGNLQLGIKLANSNTASAPSLIFDCGDLGTQEIQLWVEDDAGNKSFCTLFYTVRDNFDVCSTAGASLVAQGNIRTPGSESIEEAEVSLMNNNTLEGQKYMTSYNGEYTFDQLQNGQQYELSAYKDGDYINGVSTIDLILIQQHILGVRQFDSPYKLIAGDASNDRILSSVDLVLLRRLILGKIETLPNNHSWRFMESNQQFLNPNSPWPFTEAITFDNPLFGFNKHDFIGIKIGDVDQNAVANSRSSKSRALPFVNLAIEEVDINGKVAYHVRSTGAFKMSGLQLSVDYDSEVLLFNNIKSEYLALDRDAYFADKGTMRLSWFSQGNKSIEPDQILFTIQFEVKNTLTGINHLKLSEWDNEIYDDLLNTHQVRTSFIRGNNEEVILYQNKPNPFTKDTYIEFYLPEAGTASIEVYDLNGQKVYEVKDSYNTGLNRININRAQENLYKGIYYYQLKTQRRSLAKKMIII